LKYNFIEFVMKQKLNGNKAVEKIKNKFTIFSQIVCNYAK